jgi:hypothetical protein
MVRLFISAAIAVIFAIGGTSGTRAQAGPVVVELFTSQGCSSCPPADEYLGALAERDDVIALSLHVDYWDYLGWRDVFGAPAHTQRQRNYAAAMRERSIYTPQLVIQGSEHVVGSNIDLADKAILRQQAKAQPALVSLRIKDDLLVAEISPAEQSTLRLRGQVLMAWYSSAEEVEIQRGENRGRKLVHHNVVKGWSEMGSWSGAKMTLTAPKPMGADGVVVMVQASDGGPLLGAERLILN